MLFFGRRDGEKRKVGSGSRGGGVSCARRARDERPRREHKRGSGGARAEVTRRGMRKARERGQRERQLQGKG